jgi:hypothetical protein
VNPAIPLVTGIVRPDHDMDLLAPCYRASFDPHSAGIKAKWMINLLTAYVVDRRGGNDKAMSGNCWSLYPFSLRGCLETKPL